MASTCPVCGKLLRHERHLHAEDPNRIHGWVERQPEIVVDPNTVRVPINMALDYNDWRHHAGPGLDDEGATGGSGG